MNTFLPYSSFKKSAQVLDYKRLGKQRVEAYQILIALTTGKGWIHHPATKMWSGHEYSLTQYGIAMCKEWVKRGYRDSLMIKFMVYSQELAWDHNLKKPKWVGNYKFHESHRSNLLRKDSQWYGQFNWTEENNLPYVWPTKDLI